MSTSKVNLIIKNQNCLSKQIDSKKFVWHRRLGHLSFNTFQEFIQKKHALGIPRTLPKLHYNYEVWLKRT